MLPGVVTGVGEKDSKYQVTNNFIKTKQSKNLPVGPEIPLVPTRSLFFYPVRIENLNKLTIISRRRCHRSQHSSMSHSNMFYLRGT